MSKFKYVKFYMYEIPCIQNFTEDYIIINVAIAMYFYSTIM